MGAAVLQVQYIGGTSVPGILTKPIIDMVVEVASIVELDARASELEGMGYVSRGEHSSPGRRCFKKRARGSSVGVHVHGLEQGTGQGLQHIRFWDFRQMERGLAHAYSALKQSLASPEGWLVDACTDRKSEFVRRVLDCAERRFSKAAE